MSKTTLPKGAKKRIDGILAYGEATGHLHQATAPDVQIWDYEGGMVLDAPTGTEVTHQEHGSVLVPPGMWDRKIVQEFDHFAEEAREVVD